MSDPLSAIFMAKGMCEHPSVDLAYDIACEELGYGQTEVFHQVNDLAQAAAQAYNVYEKADFPGVFVYDVAEPLGHYIVDHIIQYRKMPVYDEIEEVALVYANQAIPEDV